MLLIDVLGLYNSVYSGSNISTYYKYAYIIAKKSMKLTIDCIYKYNSKPKQNKTFKKILHKNDILLVMHYIMSRHTLF